MNVEFIIRLCVIEFVPPPVDIDIMEPRPPPLLKLTADEGCIEMPLPPPPIPEHEF